MEPQPSCNSKEAGQLPPFLETMRQLELRLQIVRRLGLPAETEVFKQKKPQPCSIADLLRSLSQYSISTAVDPHLASIYAPAYDDVSKYMVLPLFSKKPSSYSFILLPPSEGEDSVCSQDGPFEPSFNWLAKRLTDTSLLKLDQPEPFKYNGNNDNYLDYVPEDWKGVRQLLLSQLTPGIEFEHDTETITNQIKKRFSSYPWVKIKKVRQIYFKGRPAVMVRFMDEPSAIFSHYNFKKNLGGLKSFFGEDMQVSRCTQNLMRGQPKNWVAVMFRRLPRTMSKEGLLALLKKEQFAVIWVEQPVEIKDFKYALVGVPFIDDAFKICQHFRVNPLQFKVNLHPSSSKIYQQQAVQ